MTTKNNRVDFVSATSYNPSEEIVFGSDNNLPKIVSGICEYCGSVEYVDKEGNPAVATERKSADGSVIYGYDLGVYAKPICAANCKHYDNIKITCKYCHESFTGLMNQSRNFVESMGIRKVIAWIKKGAPDIIHFGCDKMECNMKRDQECGASTFGESPVTYTINGN